VAAEFTPPQPASSSVRASKRARVERQRAKSFGSTVYPGIKRAQLHRPPG